MSATKPKPANSNSGRKRKNVGGKPEQYVSTRCLPLRSSSNDIFRLYEESEEFRKAFNEGDYIFVDGLFVLRSVAVHLLEHNINANDYFKIAASMGVNHGLVDYCLHFELQWVSYPYDPNVLRHSSGYIKSKRIAHAAKVADIHTITKEMLAGIVGGGQEPPNDFGKLLAYYMNRKNVTEEDLAELTGISTRTIGRLRNETDYRPSLEYVVAICVGMHLLPSESARLLAAAGYHLRSNDKEQTYQYLIDVAYNNSVYECNEFLKRMDRKPLTEL